MENNEKDDGYSEEDEYETSWDLYQNTLLGAKISLKLLSEYAESPHPFLRQTAAKHILEGLQLAVKAVEAYSEQDDVEKFLQFIIKLSQDEEMMVRCNMLNSFQEVASFCAYYDSPLVSIKSIIVSNILPIILKDIADESKTRNIQVRNKAYCTLKYLITENLVTPQDIEDAVCAIYETLMVNPPNVLHIITAGNFISRMPPIVGEEATEKILLPKISELCSHPHAKVREASVHFLVDLACFVNSMITENIIVPLFIKLSQDEDWCVKEACAETAVMLSCLCLMESRKTVLCLAFIDLLHTGEIVTQSTFKHLGPFITTFAQPAITGLACNHNGDFVLVYSKDFEFPLHSRRTLFQCCEQELSEEMRPISIHFSNEWDDDGNYQQDEDSFNNNNNEGRYENEQVYHEDHGGDDNSMVLAEKSDLNANNELGNKYENQPDLIQSCLIKNDQDSDANKKTESSSTTELTDTVTELQDHFNSFQFWRDPIPDFDENDLLNVPMRKEKPCETSRRKRRRILEIHSKLRGRECPPKLNITCTTPEQNIVPQPLIDAFITIPQSYPVLTTDCAYTFPAVLLTLGASNWDLLKTFYFNLVLNFEKKVRKMTANNIHEIAAILGPELATQDLIPMYKSLIDDLEDIRITALNHLSCFIKLLRPNGRSLFLPHLMEYMMTDYSWNWRFRKQLSEQLIEMMNYFTPSDCWKYVSPVALTLLMDRVSAVRLEALNLVTNLIRNVSADITLLRGILADLAEQFAHSTQWSRRQSFAFLCSRLLRNPVLPDDMFARDVLPHLLDLSWDVIPNVRIAVARTLADDVINYPYFSNIFSPHYDILTQVLKRLRSDKDRDVKYFASIKTPQLSRIEVKVTI